MPEEIVQPAARRRSFLTFFSIFFSLYLSLNAYIFFKGWQLLPPLVWARLLYSLSFWLIALAYVSGRFLERLSLGKLYWWLDQVGSYWFVFFEYFFLLALASDFLRLLLWPFGIHPLAWFSDPALAKLYLGLGVVLVVSALVLVGAVIARYPVVKRLQLELPAAPGRAGKALRLALLTDVHIGTLVSPHWVCSLVAQVLEQEADLIVMAGDILDGDVEPVIKKNLGDSLKTLKAPLGVWACLGNHEHFGGREVALNYLREHNIQVLVDEGAELGGQIYLVGREDASSQRMGLGPRKTLAQILADRPADLPVLVLDHQPVALQEAVEAGVALQLSGHTHRGQFWPNPLITRRVFQLDYGYRRIGNTHFYVSCGVGTWGPPVRLGTRPEIVVIDLKFC